MNANDALTAHDELATVLRSSGGADDLIPVKGHVLVEVFGPDGDLRDFREVDNLITTVGRNAIVEVLLASPAANQKPTHMGVGTGSVAATVGDTTMTAEVRVALTSKTRGTNILTMVGDWAAGTATQANTEAGLWDAASAAQLLARAVFAAINKGASDTLKITWTWTIG